VGLVRRWWPIVAIFGVDIAAQVVVRSRYDARGHAAGHLSSAEFIFPATALVATILWSLPRTRRQPDVLIAAAAWLAAVGTFSIANFRVVDSIGGASWSSEEADRLGASVPGFESGHDLAAVAAPLGLLGALALAIVLGRRGHVTKRAVVGSCGMSLLIPFFLIPGAGVAVLAASGCLQRRKQALALS
jgi:hypothetical protein